MLKKVGQVILLIVILFAVWLGYQLTNRPDLKTYSSYFVTQPTVIDYANQLSAQYFGTSTIVISDGETSIMTDGFFTRPGLLTMLLGKMQPDSDIIQKALRQANIVNLAAVIPVHSHHDHALDAPEVAAQTGAILLGSESTANIATGWGLPESQILVARDRHPTTFGQFTVTLIRSRHLTVSQSQADLTGIGKTIDQPMHFPAPLDAFMEGGSYSVLIQHRLGDVLIHGSAGFEPDALIGMTAETVFLGIGGLGDHGEDYQKAYMKNTIDTVQAINIIPIHWDDFNRSINQPLTPFIKLIADLDGDMAPLVDNVAADPEKKLIMLGYGGKLGL